MKLGMMMGVKLGFGNSKDRDEEEHEIKDGHDSWNEVGYVNEFGNGDNEDGDEHDDIWGGNEEDEVGDRDDS